jgi:Uma2 family endonuclease
MPTLVLDPAPPQLQELLERRRRLDLDRCDEVWGGVLHMNPAPHTRHGRIEHQLGVLLDAPGRDAGLVAMGQCNLGDPDDYRVPDGGLFASAPDELYCATAALVIEIVSPGDDTWDKLPFYAAHQVDELLIVDPQEQRVHWLALTDGQYVPAEQSGLIELGPGELAELINWP